MDSTRANSLHSQEKAANSGEDDRSARATSDSLPNSFVSDEEPGTKNSNPDDNDDDEPYSDSDYGARLDMHFPQIREGFNNNTSVVRQPQPYTIHLLDNKNCIIDKDQYGRKIRAQLTLDPDDYQPHVKIEVTREASREPSKSTSEEREQCDSVAVKYTFTSIDRYLNHPKDENLGSQIGQLNDPSTAHFASMPPETSERVIAITNSRFRQAFLCMIIHREEGILDMGTFWDVPAWAREVAPVLTQRNIQFVIEGPSNTGEAVATFVEFLAKKNYGYLEFHRGKYKDLLSYTDENMNPPGSVSLKSVDYGFQAVCQFQDPHELATLEFVIVSESLRILGEGVAQFNEGIHNLIVLPAPPVHEFSTTYFGYLEIGQHDLKGKKTYTPRFGDSIQISFDLRETWDDTMKDRTDLIWTATIWKPLNIRVPIGWLPCLLERPRSIEDGIFSVEPRITGSTSTKKETLEAILRNPAGQAVRARLVTKVNPLSNVKENIGRMVNDTRLDPFTSWNVRINHLLLGTRLDKLEEHDFFECMSQELGPDLLKLLKLDPNQAAALAMARKSIGGVTFIQGPPGTGKSHITKQVASLGLLCRTSQPQVVICCPNNLTADAIANDINENIPQHPKGTPRQRYAVRIYAETADRQYRDLHCAKSSKKSPDSEPSGNPRPGTSRDNIKKNLHRLPEISRGIVSAILEAEDRPTKGIDDTRFALPHLSVGHYMLESVGLIAGQPAWPGFKDKHRDFVRLQQLRSEGKHLNRDENSRFTEASNELFEDILRNATVIVSTTANIAAPRTIEAIESTVTNLIFEENTREAEINLVPIFAARFRRDPKMLVIGDQCQLSPQAPVAVADLAFARQCELSFMIRMIAAGHPCHILTTNYRMAPDIAEPINRLIYHGRLSNHRSVEADCRPFQIQFRKYIQEKFQIVDCNAVWLDTAPGGKNITEVNSITRSRKNEFHAGLTLHIVEELLNTDAGSKRQPKVTIITMYEDQKSLYFQAKSQMQVLNAVRVENLDFVNTDGAQGLEWDFVVVDLSLSEQAGFAADPRRLNVAFSRARDGLIIVGNAKQISNMKGAQILKNFKNYYIKNKKSYTVKSDEWFVSKYFSPTEPKRLPERPSRR